MNKYLAVLEILNHPAGYYLVENAADEKDAVEQAWKVIDREAYLLPGRDWDERWSATWQVTAHPMYQHSVAGVSSDLKEWEYEQET
jgi:hypothetical protein